MKRSEIRGLHSLTSRSRIARSLSSGAHSRDPSAPTCRSIRATPRARTAEFVEADQCDLPCPVPFPKIIPFPPDPNQNYNPRRPALSRGAFRDRHGRWARDAMDAGCVADEQRLARGRRSRVVLTPRRRRQIGGGNSADDGDNKARSPGRARRKPLKPLRAGMPGESGWTCGDYARVLVSLSHARLRVRRAPGIPHALWGGWFMHNSGASRREIVEFCLDVIARSDLSAVAQ
jgi:hypothetical protein